MDVFIPRERFTNNPRGFGFVTFHDRRDAEDAEDATNEKELDGRVIKVNFAKQRPPREEARARREAEQHDRGYGGGYGGGRDRYDDRRGYDRRDRDYDRRDRGYDRDYDRRDRDYDRRY